MNLKQDIFFGEVLAKKEVLAYKLAESCKKVIDKLQLITSHI